VARVNRGDLKGCSRPGHVGAGSRIGRPGFAPLATRGPQGPLVGQSDGRRPGTERHPFDRWTQNGPRSHRGGRSKTRDREEGSRALTVRTGQSTQGGYRGSKFVSPRPGNPIGAFHSLTTLAPKNSSPRIPVRVGCRRVTRRGQTGCQRNMLTVMLLWLSDPEVPVLLMLVLSLDSETKEAKRVHLLPVPSAARGAGARMRIR